MASITQFSVSGNTVIYTDRPLGRKYVAEFQNNSIFEVLKEPNPKKKDLKTIVRLIKKNGGRRNIASFVGFGD
jgi:hypothetical protein